MQDALVSSLRKRLDDLKHIEPFTKLVVQTTQKFTQQSLISNKLPIAKPKENTLLTEDIKLSINKKLDDDSSDNEVELGENPGFRNLDEDHEVEKVTKPYIKDYLEDIISKILLGHHIY